MSMLSRRLQVLIDEERLRRLEAEADRRNVPVSVVVRDAIDAAYPVDRVTRESAAERILGVAPMAAPPLGELISELDELRAGRP